ncbi:hypothetical protein [Acinetobacter sp. ANC 4648]|uniref:A1S_1983 family putative colistin resistance protein n=1 Tax=Acinetobacter sp. ANC 4648 TaxID=1977875 RepID=UPI000A3487FE|nr:hypothetical protein [Acinetobacter sp. ANC 4648]OTG82912.1 hypothetical protein B9T27_06475 [Acinetobacter sp. ANC 4648]
MLLKTEFNLIKNIVLVLWLGHVSMSITYAQAIQCESQNTSSALQKLCHDDLKQLRHKFNEKYMTAFLVTDAPTRLVDDTNTLWLNRIQQCKNMQCYKQQFDLRLEDLNFYTSMNQSLTQHFIKYEQGQIAKQPVHLQVHQLTKERIKIEGIAYRNPNNRKEKQIVSLLAYTTANKKNEIIDNEHDCKYQLNFQKAILVIKSNQKGCERFVGTYRLYD